MHKINMFFIGNNLKRYKKIIQSSYVARSARNIALDLNYQAFLSYFIKGDCYNTWGIP